MKKTADIIVAGAGVIGLTTSLRLAQAGLKVILIDRQQVGREASWAGAGMLPPGNLSKARTAEARLRAHSHHLWDDFASELHNLTGIDTGYHRCGAIELNDGADSTHLLSILRGLESEHIRFESLDPHGLRQAAPEINGNFLQALRIPDFGQVRNPRHLKALEIACRKLGVQILQNDHIKLSRDQNGTVSLESPHQPVDAPMICVAAGAWTNSLLNSVGFEIPVQPVRGQIVQLRPTSRDFDHVIQLGRRYLVPRKDGLVLVGSTEEHDGFSKHVTVSGVQELLEFAECLVPGLKTAEVVRQWAGLRPGSPDELPFLGQVPSCENLFVAAGHFRSGLQMSIGTAEIMTQLITGQNPAISLEGLTADRVVPRAYRT